MISDILFIPQDIECSFFLEMQTNHKFQMQKQFTDFSRFHLVLIKR